MACDFLLKPRSFGFVNIRSKVSSVHYQEPMQFVYNSRHSGKASQLTQHIHFTFTCQTWSALRSNSTTGLLFNLRKIQLSIGRKVYRQLIGLRFGNLCEDVNIFGGANLNVAPRSSAKILYANYIIRPIDGRTHCRSGQCISHLVVRLWVAINTMHSG